MEESQDDKRLLLAMRAYAESQVETFREGINHKDVPLQTFALFLLLSSHSQVSVSQITQLFKPLSQAAVSRNISLLSGDSRIRKDGGLGLAETFEDIHDRRSKLVRLSTKGRALREQMHTKGRHIFNRILGIGD